jgi:Tol biopolymer transport system component
MKNRNALFVALALTIVCAGPAFAQQTAEELYQAGLHQEEVQGNLERAVEIYQTILNDHANNRAVAAKAQLHIGICYETLGLQEAQRAYERVVANYGEQSEVVSQARARLAVLGQYAAREPATSGPVARMIFSGMNPEDRGIRASRAIIPAPDGHRFAYGASGDIYIRDQATGVTEQVAAGGPTKELTPPVWSTDGKQLAFSVRDTVTNVSLIKILDLSTRATRTIPMPAEGGAYLMDWTRDGRYLLYNDMRAQSLRILAIDDGSVTAVSDGVWPWQRATFSPDGRFVVYGHGGALGARPICVQSVTGGSCHEIAMSGAEMYPHPLWSPDGSAIAYQDDEGIWVVPMTDGMAAGPPRLAYRTTAARWAAAWTAAGGVHFTALNQHNAPWRVEVDPRTGQVAGSGAQELTEYPELRSFHWSPDGRQVALLGWSYRDVTVYSVDTKARTPFRDLEQEGGIPRAIWSPDGQELWYEYGAGAGSGRGLKAIDLETGQVRELFTLKNGGGISFSDDGRTMAFVRPGSVSGSAEIVVAETGEADGRVVTRVSGPDGAQLAPRVVPELSPQGDKVFYVVRQRPSAGSNAAAIWVVGVDGAEARQVVTAAEIRGATWDPRGRLIAYTTRMPDRTGNALRVVNVSTGEDHELPVPNEDHSLVVVDWSRDGRYIGYMRLEFWWEYWAVNGLLNGGQ